MTKVIDKSKITADSSSFPEATARQKKLWDKTRNIRSVVAGGVRPSSDIYAELYKTLIAQEIIEFYRGAPSLSEVYGEEDWYNGLKEFFAQSLYDVEELSDIRADVAIGDFNADDNEFQSVVAKVDTTTRIKWVIPAGGFVEVFSTPAKLEAFTNARIRQTVNTFDDYLFQEKSKILLGATGAKISLTWDKTVDFGAESAFNTDQKIKESLEQMRNYVSSLATPSKEHLALNRDKWKYSAKPENLIMVMNSTYYNQISTLASTLFNKDDVMVKLDKVVIDFSKIEGVVKTDVAKIKAMIIDKNALRYGKQVSLTKEITLPTINNLMVQFNWFGFARLKFFAMAKFATS